MEITRPKAVLDSAGLRYGVALALILIAFVLRVSLLPLESRLAFETFYPAVVLSFYICGLGPGAAVALIGAVTGIYYFSPPYGSWGADTGSWWAAAGFLASSVIAAWVVHRLQLASAALTRANRLLKVGEDKLRVVVEAQTEMLFQFAPDGRFMFANKVGQRMFALNQESLAQGTWRELVRPDERAGVAERIRHLTPQSPVVRTETSYPGPQGEQLWVEFVHRAMFDDDGDLSEVHTVGRDITERRKLQEQMRQLGEELRDLYEHAPCAYFSVNAAGVFIRLNSTAAQWMGCTPQEAQGHLRPEDFFTPEGARLYSEAFARFLVDGLFGPLEFDLLGRHGERRRVSMTCTAVHDAGGAVASTRSLMYDVSELYRIRNNLVALNRQQSVMLDNELVGIVRLKDRRIVWKNRAMERLFGYGPGEMDDLPMRQLHVDEASYLHYGTTAYPYLASGGTYRAQQKMRRKDGETLWVDLSGTQLSADTGESMWMLLDITAMKEHTERVERAAFHDALTGLPNRVLLMDRLHQVIPLTRRLQSLLAVCFVDLDGFKSINDHYGHGAGDRLLQLIAQRLQDTVRGNDTVARFGGDEFVLVLTHLQSREECAAILERTQAAVCEPAWIDSQTQASVSASTGVALCPGDAVEVEELIARADDAMYRAKSRGKDGIVFFGDLPAA